MTSLVGLLGEVELGARWVGLIKVPFFTLGVQEQCMDCISHQCLGKGEISVGSLVQNITFELSLEQ